MSFHNYGTFVRVHIPADELISLKKSGWSNKQLAEKYDVSIPTVRSRLIEVAPNLCGKSIQTKKVQFDEDVLELRLFGLSKNQIARLYGCSADTVQTHLRKLERESGQRLGGYIPVTLDVDWDKVSTIERKGYTIARLAKENECGVLDVLLEMLVKGN